LELKPFEREVTFFTKLPVISGYTFLFYCSLFSTASTLSA